MSDKKSQGASIVLQNQLVQWINDAGMVEGGKRVALLRKINEVLLHQAAPMIPVYMDNILSYVNDKSTEVKKIVVAFIEGVSQLHPQYLPKVMGQLRQLLSDAVIAVQKRAIQGCSILYRQTLLWVCREDAPLDTVHTVWHQLSELKLMILNMIDNDNEGIRTHSIKFLEEVVVLQSAGPEELQLSLDRLPGVDARALEDEAEHIFTLLLKFHNSQHISSVNLMACMTTLCTLAKVRPKFMPRVIQALADLHTTLPPTLSQSQVNSVRKHLKMLLLNAIKNTTSNDMFPALTQLLMDIGMTTQEINKALPKERRNKRLGELKNSDIPFKRLRVDSPQSNSQGSDSNSRSDFNEDDNSQSSNIIATSIAQIALPPVQPTPSVTVVTKATATEDSILDGLDKVENVVALVMSTLVNNLPIEMPDYFINLYKPIPNAGSRMQKKSLAKMILAVVKDDPVVPQPPKPTLSDLAAKIPLLKDEDDEKMTLKNAVAKLQESTKADKKVEDAVSKLMEETRQEHLKEEERRIKEKEREKEKLIPPQTPTVPKLKQKVKLLKLQEITRPIPKEIKEKLMIQAVARILNAEKESAIGGAAHMRAKFITIFASSYTPEIRDLVLSYILEEPANRIELALAWLYEEYAFMQGFNRHPVTLQPKVHEKHDQNYNQLLCALITQVCERGDPAVESCKDVLLRKIYSEAPIVTPEAVEYLKHLVCEERFSLLALELLDELCVARAHRAHKYLPALLPHVLSEQPASREQALSSVVRLYPRATDAARKVIEKHALLYLGFIALGLPPPELLGGRHVRQPWNEHLYKVCLSLVMALFADNEELIMDIARVYGCCEAEAKRCVLRALEAPLRGAIARGGEGAVAEGAEGEGGLRPAFAALLEQCPRGAETLLTRLVHMLTEKAPPSPELVRRVRALYATRVADVRFLIPVLCGLTKAEVLAALPKLIKLNPAVVREVFNRLLGLHHKDDVPPVTPEELLVELHLIDPAKADLKYIIKATAICFAEKQVYTQDVVAGVIQRLSAERETPVLMMRSVLQALTLYPALQPLVLTVLGLLVEREVWTHKVCWEGWVKCVCRLPVTVAGADVLPLLPPPALRAALAAAPALRARLQQYAAGRPAALPPHVLAACEQQPQLLPQPVPAPNPMEPLPPGME